MKHKAAPKLASGLLATILAISSGVPAQAAAQTEQEAAASLQAQGIMVGDGSGDPRLDDTLTRAELACLLSPISLNPEHVAWETGFYTKMCTVNFDDVPEWARVHVGVCASNGLMAGYGDRRFGPGDPVTPAAACSVMLRYVECPADTWNYDNACAKAAELGLVPEDVLTAEEITRGGMAVLLCRSMEYIEQLNA